MHNLRASKACKAGVRGTQVSLKNTSISLKSTPVSLKSTQVSLNSSPVSLTVSIYVGGCSCLTCLACFVHASHVCLACLTCLVARTLCTLKKSPWAESGDIENQWKTFDLGKDLNSWPLDWILLHCNWLSYNVSMHLWHDLQIRLTNISSFCRKWVDTPLATGGPAVLSLSAELGRAFVAPALVGRDLRGGCGITLVCQKNQCTLYIQRGAPFHNHTWGRQ